jgi:aconitate hydratase
MERYLRATGRDDVANAANEVKEDLTADAEVYNDPSKYFDQLIEINLDELMPHINGPFTPDLATPIGEMSSKAKKGDWPIKVEWGLIGSCTNSSYEDLSRAASIAKQAVDKKLTTKAEFGINPGSEQVRYTAERDGLLEIFEDLDAKIFTHVLVSGHARALTNRKKTPSFTHLIEIFLNVQMAIQILMHLLHHQKWLLQLRSLVV